MREIVNRLHESRQIELAKEILESNGYKITKRLKEFGLRGLLSTVLDDPYYTSAESWHFQEGEELYTAIVDTFGGLSDVYVVSSEDEDPSLFNNIDQILQDARVLKDLAPGERFRSFDVREKHGFKFIFYAEGGAASYFFHIDTRD